MIQSVFTEVGEKVAGPQRNPLDFDGNPDIVTYVRVKVRGGLGEARSLGLGGVVCAVMSLYFF